MIPLSRDEAIAYALTIFPPMLDAPQLGFLYDLATAAPDGFAIEIGVFRGSSLALIAAARRGRGVVVGVDDYAAHGQTNDYWPRSVSQARAAVEPVLIDPRHATFIEAPSEWAAGCVPSRMAAFVFLDGAHALPDVAIDLALWPAKLRRGGILAIHDYGSAKHDYMVTPLVDAWQAAQPWPYLGLVGTLVAFRRP